MVFVSRQSTILATTVVVIALSCGLGFAQEQPVSANSSQRHYALLVGCTKYPNLPTNRHLNGPANDVELMGALLINRFDYKKSEIVVLSERQANEMHRPRRENIVREMNYLVERVQRGDTVVILLAGHGAQQPDDDPENPEDIEPDGLDEVFLPSDIGEWEEEIQQIKNAILDDEIRHWLTGINDKGAFVWFIADTCHSGTISRDIEVSREVGPGELVPVKALQDARAIANRNVGIASRGRKQTDLPKTAGIVALYASQSNETAPEKPMPRDGADRKYYGLLTYTVNQVLLQVTDPITYRELVQRVHQQYLQWGRSGPTPLMEGDDLDREILGQRKWQGRSRILLDVGQSGQLSINVGRLHGVMAGSILRVYPAAGTKSDQTLLGHVRVERTEALRATVVSCDFDSKPRQDDFSAGARCELAYIDYGDRRLKVAVDFAGDPNEEVPQDEAMRVADALKELAKQPTGIPIEYVESIKSANWFVRISKGKIYLSRVADGVQPGHSNSTLFGPKSLESDWQIWMETSLRRIAKATSLLSLSQNKPTGLLSPSDVNVEVEMVLYVENKQVSQSVPWNNGRKLTDGNVIAFRVHNRGLLPVDVTLLVVTADFRIQAILPRNNFLLNRIGPNEKLTSVKAQVTSAPDWEHVVMIAVRSEPQRQPQSFTWLAQPAIEQTRGVRDAGNSPLHQLFETYAFGEGQTRGFNTETIGNYAVKILSWKTVDRPNDRK